MPKIIAFGAALVVCVSASFWLARRAPPTPQADAASTPGEQAEEIAALRRELARVRTEVALRRDELPVPEATEPQAAQPESDQALVPPTKATNHADLLAASKAEQLKYLDRLDTQFATEGRDASWNVLPEVQTKLTKALPAQSKVREVTCRSSMCRVETLHRDLDAYREFLEKAFNDPSDPTNVWAGSANFTIVNTPEEDGEVQAVAYLLREDRQFPSADPGALDRP